MTVWSVSEVLEQIPELGIPHFQRGQVWGTEARSALLESLFFDTPCGSFVLWALDDCASKGVPLDPAKCKGMKYLIIDGQQRIRSLHAIFNKRADPEEEAGENGGQCIASDDGGDVWCINLTKTPWFAPHLKAPDRDFALFVHIRDPAAPNAEKVPSPLRSNMLPLRKVFEEESWSSDGLKPYRELLKLDSRNGDLSSDDWQALYGRLRESVLAMLKQEFFVSIQKKSDLAEMANLYNRINAGGKRVDVEERAFARLVGLQPITYDHLTRLFESVHGKVPTRSKEGNGERLDRDEVLARLKERSFGFKLFIRVFLQVCGHHLGFRQSRTDFSFDLADRARFLAAFKALEAEQVARLWAQAKDVLVCVRDLLRDDLFCDDFRFLPETYSLTPILQLLIIYPRLREAQYRRLLASLCLRLFLAELDSRTLLDLLDEAADKGRAAFDVIPAMFEILDKANAKSAKLSARLQQANSIQHRFVLMLYWLERRLGAKDFVYAPNKVRLTPPELSVDEHSKPEKQHLLPFVKAQALYHDGLRRGDSHIVNSVGNLTYISEKENSFDWGLGDSFALLGNKEEPGENKRAHLLIDRRGDARVLKEYEGLRRLFGAKDERPIEKARAKAVRTFERMARYRRKLIAEEFEAWHQELENDACAKLKRSNLKELRSLADIPDRVEQESPWFAPIDAIDAIRGFGLANEEETRLIVLVKNAAKVLPGKDNSLERDIYLTKRKRVWVKAAPAGTSICFNAIVPIEHRQQILEAIDRSMDATSDPLPLNPVPDFKRLLELMKSLGPQIENLNSATQSNASKQ